MKSKTTCATGYDSSSWVDDRSDWAIEEVEGDVKAEAADDGAESSAREWKGPDIYRLDIPLDPEREREV